MAKAKEKAHVQPEEKVGSLLERRAKRQAENRVRESAHAEIMDQVEFEASLKKQIKKGK